MGVEQHKLQIHTNAALRPAALHINKFIYHVMMSSLPINCVISQDSLYSYYNHQALGSPTLRKDVLSLCFPSVCVSSPDPARVVNMPSVIYVAIGLPGFIRCPVDANPPVTLVKWKKDGLPLRIDKVS